MPRRSQRPPVRPFSRRFDQLSSIPKAKRSRTARSLSPSIGQFKSSRCHQVTSSPKPEAISSNVDGVTTSTDGKNLSRNGNPFFEQLSKTHGMDLQQCLRERLIHWSRGVEYIAPPEDRQPPRKRLKTSRSESDRLKAKGKDAGENGFHSMYRTRFFHFACPFYIHNPEKNQQCLLQYDFVGIETLPKHLIQQHEEPLHCHICKKTFESLIDRDGHTLENACRGKDQEPLEGLTESQKVRLIKRDRHDLGEKQRWDLFWSAAFPGTEKPPSPYLVEGDGLCVSMIRDFWVVDGRQFVSDFLSSLENHDDEKSEADDSIYRKAFEGLMDWVIKQDNKSVILSCDR
ncbi:hypothetical protein FNAPI_3197 [Fusarium napiforme]|uniref:C2H2-type domain-containing protein n=1 Tax=Fusarium napiforme TaxID=42672 RepID=A0A8H5NDT4_9HYPO|nr:hypothetical protein FNAPI_3197 [Fusarium napiforme]